MGYQTVHRRYVRGGSRVHETMEDKTDRFENESLIELSPESVDTEFLLPSTENFIETSPVKRLKNRVTRWVKIGYPPHIVGPTGVGKTALAMKVAEELGQPTLWINGDEQMTTADLIGGYSEMETQSVRDRFVHNVLIAKDRTKYTWVDNPLTIACKYGYTLVYNEFSRAKPIANNVLLSVLEEGILELPIMFGKERYVKVHPDFNIIFTSNSIEYAGVFQPQDALLDRMVDIYMDYYDFETEMKIVMQHTGVKLSEAKQIVNAVRDIRDKVSSPSKPGTRSGIMIGYGLMAMGKYSREDLMEIYMDVLGHKITGQGEFEKTNAVVEQALHDTYGDL